MFSSAKSKAIVSSHTPNLAKSFMNALETGDLKLVSVLLQLNSNLQHHCFDGDYLLHLLCKHNHVDFLKEVLDLGVDIYKANAQGLTAFDIALSLKLMNFELIDAAHKKALDYAIQLNHPEVMDIIASKTKPSYFIYQNGWGRTKIYQAIEDKNELLFECCLKYMLDLNISDNQQMTPLIFAVLHKRAEFIKLLLDKPIQVHLKDDQGLTALDYALKQNIPSVIDALAKTVSLHQAIAIGNDLLFYSSLQQCGDIGVKDENGFSPLVAAALFKRPDYERALMKQMAKKLENSM